MGFLAQPCWAALLAKPLLRPQSRNDMLERTGSCLCGGVQYKVCGEPVISRVCWCRTCQKISGNGTANVIFPTSSIEVTGPMSCYTSRADSGNDISRHFCPSCGCHLFAGSSASPQYRVVRLGTLDDPSSITPTINMWASSAPSWACLDPALKTEARQPAPLQQVSRPPYAAESAPSPMMEASGPTRPQR